MTTAIKAEKTAAKCPCAVCVSGKIPASGCSLFKHEFEPLHKAGVPTGEHGCWNCGKVAVVPHLPGAKTPQLVMWTPALGWAN